MGVTSAWTQVRDCRKPASVRKRRGQLTRAMLYMCLCANAQYMMSVDTFALLCSIWGLALSLRSDW